MNKTPRIKLKLTEYTWREDDCGREDLHSQFVYEIDLSKWEQFEIDNNFAAGYVDDIINNVLQGRTNLTESRKYTFHDMEDAYTPLFTEDPDSAFDQVIEATVNTYI